MAAKPPFGISGRLSVSDEEEFRYGHDLMIVRAAYTVTASSFSFSV